ncbi:MAG: TVP38/TMEM64 family protein [Gammaproteobacteria bacterium]|nr:TVP38/TMEM64 family protein [Gammaproteobacteria bacterium]
MLNKASIVWGIAASCLFVAGLLALLFHFGLQDRVVELLRWIDSIKPWGPVVFILLVMLVVIFLLPGVLFTLGAGFLFGVVKGSIYVIVATTLGAVIAFLTARHLFGENVSNYLRNHPRLSVINNVLAHEDWKIVLVTRLIPFFPFKLSNYFFGLTKFSLRGFALGTFIGIWPITIINVYIGSITADLAMLGTPGNTKSGLEWLVYGGGLLIAVVGIVYISHRAQQALAPYMNTLQSTEDTE